VLALELTALMPSKFAIADSRLTVGKDVMKDFTLLGDFQKYEKGTSTQREDSATGGAATAGRRGG
jgi:hypothetical protein